ncbi:hypothetical protein Trydic_g3967 [Trypoxylus dichotomus]
MDVLLIGETHLRASDRLSLRNIEATNITVNLATGPIQLVAAYKAPNKLMLESDLSEIFSTRRATILAGDLNAKHPTWNSRLTNASGKCLRRFADDFNLVVDASTEPTIYPHNGQPDVLDIVVMKNVNHFHQLTVLNELSSDHNPVLLQLGQPTPEEEDTPTRHSVSWPAFTDHLSNNMGPIERIEDVTQLEAEVQTVTDRVLESVQYATNIIPIHDNRAFIPREIRDLIRQKNQLRRRWQRTLDPAYKAEYNDLAWRTKAALDQFRNKRWDDFMNQASESTSAFWRAAKIMKCRRTPMPPIHGERGIAYSNEDKAEAFAEALEKQCSPNYEDADVDHIGRVHRRVRRILAEEDEEEPLPPASPEEIRAIIRAFRTNKAPGSEGITNSALKHAPKKFVMHMTNICNAMLRLRHFPTNWKLADVAMIPKPGQAANWPQNYRPISLLPVMGKIAERIILRGLKDEVEDLEIIPDSQFGFRSEHNTTLQVLRVVEHIKQGFNLKEYTGAVFLDVAKAFDKVWHQGLPWKMHRAGISKAMLRLIRSYLRRRSFRIKLEGQRSVARTATSGVPQGSALSPLLFNIYTSDIPTTAHVNMAMYADDVCIYTRSLDARVVDRRLQEALDALQTWYARWRIAIHPGKSTAILFSGSGCRLKKHGNPTELTIQGGIVP